MARAKFDRISPEKARKRAAKNARKRAKQAAYREEVAQWRGFKSAKEMDRVAETRTDSPTTSKRKPSRVRHIS